ncbi:MAG: STAS domain-containing protein [Pseudonocardiaceae bacterium]
MMTTHDLTRRKPRQLLWMSVQDQTPELRVVAVSGDLDMLTAPLLDECLREQLNDAIPRLVVDLEGVEFLGACGLRCLLQARELAETTGVALHLAGLVNRAAERPFGGVFPVAAVSLLSHPGPRPAAGSSQR